MIIVGLKGGLGNQMFQYAAGRRLAHIHNTQLKLDTTAYYYGGPRQFELHNFNIKENIATTEEINRLKEVQQNRFATIIYRIFHAHPKIAKTHIRHNKAKFNPKILQLPDNVYLDGYFMSEKYFVDIADILRREFTFKNSPDSKNLQMLDKIDNRNAVGIHIRRGDYVSEQKTADSHGACGIDYYRDAIGILTKEFNNLEFFIFSDDPAWCRTNLKLSQPATFVSFNTAEKSYEDLRLMSRCRHNIIANSTFSWWAGWLNENKDKTVIFPKNWFAGKNLDLSDIIPQSSGRYIPV